MKPRLFNIFCLLSLSLGLACVGMWIRSGYVGDILEKNHGNVFATRVISVSGFLLLEVVTITSPRPAFPPGMLRWDTFPEEEYVGSPSPNWDFHWPSYRTNKIVNGRIPGELLLPYWLLTLATTLLPGAWFRKRWKARHPKKEGLCPKCGYDLRASPLRCPECGTPVSIPASE